MGWFGRGVVGGVLLGWSLACTGAAEPPSPPEPAAGGGDEAPAPAPERGRKGGKRKAKAGGGEGAGADPQGKIPATGVPDPLAGLSDAELCSSGTLLMLKYSFDDLQGGKCNEVCCAAVPEHWCCDLDWPFSDVPPCSAYSEMRNGIFSRYGYPFEDPKWRQAFEGTSYYRRRDDFDAGWLTAKAADNIATLKRKEERKEGCMD